MSWQVHDPRVGRWCSRNSASTAASSSRSCVGDSSDSEGEVDVEDDVEFLQGLVWKCKWMGLAEFSMIPVVFTLARMQYLHVVVAVVVFQIMLLFMAQIYLCREVTAWVCQHVDYGWQKHIAALDPQTSIGYVLLSELCVYFGSLSEALDPSMDAWTAANSDAMCRSSDEKFAAWAPIPVGLIGRMGLVWEFSSFACAWHVASLRVSAEKRGRDWAMWRSLDWGMRLHIDGKRGFI